MGEEGEGVGEALGVGVTEGLIVGVVDMGVQMVALLFEVVSGGQGMGLVVERGQKKSGGQGWQLVALVFALVKYPAGQILQSARLTPPGLRLKLPRGQGLGEAEPVGQ